jgi:PTH1 family peptidyl-tRNA hydrolase
MKVVVGLGNPGARYRETRHNVGFMVLELLAASLGATAARSRFEGELAEATLGETSVLLVEPQTWMNLSGRCVRQVMHYYRIDASELLVVCDDLALPLGKIRIRRRGSAGGHKGLQDIIDQLGTEEYPRLRVGIGAAPPEWDPADWVLSRFSRDALPTIREAVERAAEAVECWILHGDEAAMNRYN